MTGTQRTNRSLRLGAQEELQALNPLRLEPTQNRGLWHATASAEASADAPWRFGKLRSSLMNPPRRVVSVSLGSKSRDHVSQAELLGQLWQLERVGVDGDLKLARQKIAELDGHVAAIGLGGIDLYIVAGGRRYVVRDAAKLAAAAKTTPVVDGSGLKDTLERATIDRLDSEGIVPLRGRRVGLTCAVDRFGMAEALVNIGARVSFGDLLFVLNLPIPLRSLRVVSRLGALILPIATRLPFPLLYPTGASQTQIKDSAPHRRFFEEHDIIAGDFLLMRRFLPADLSGKTIVTNTVTEADIELLRARRLQTLVTTTPEFGGRSFGTNVMEGIFAALGDRTPHQYRARLEELSWMPRVVNFGD